MRCVVIILTCLSLFACSSEPTRIFVLSANTKALPQKKKISNKLAIFGIGPVSIPNYLATPQIITRSLGPEIYLNDFAYWGEPLNDNIRDVIAEYLMANLPISRVVNYPWVGNLDIKYRLIVDVQAFDVNEVGLARLKADWYLTNAEGGKIYLARSVNFKRYVAKNDYTHIVEALNQNLNQFSVSVVKALQKHM